MSTIFFVCLSWVRKERKTKASSFERYDDNDCFSRYARFFSFLLLRLHIFCPSRRLWWCWRRRRLFKSRMWLVVDMTDDVSSEWRRRRHMLLTHLRAVTSYVLTVLTLKQFNRLYVFRIEHRNEIKSNCEISFFLIFSHIREKGKKENLFGFLSRGARIIGNNAIEFSPLSQLAAGS